jgi:hypothetical protein
MQLQSFKIFILDVINEAKRLRNKDITGKELTHKKFTHTTLLSISFSVASIFILKEGFSDNFAGYTIAFLGIFIGLFTTILISIEAKRDSMFKDFNSLTSVEQGRLLKVKNHFTQFSAIVSYSIIIALFVAFLLLITLAIKQTHQNIFNYHFASYNQWNFSAIVRFFWATGLIIYRAVVVYFLSSFFFNTLYSLSSYFSLLISENRRFKLKKITPHEEEV